MSEDTWIPTFSSYSPSPLTERETKDKMLAITSSKFDMRKQNDRWRTKPELWEKLKPIAHEKRDQPTEAEKALWNKLRMRRLHGLKFRSQHCIGQFIVDFYCKEVKLVIEVDGEIHQYQVGEDKNRQEFLENKGLKVIRFSNVAVLKNIDEVIRQIESSLPCIT